MFFSAIVFVGLLGIRAERVWCFPISILYIDTVERFVPYYLYFFVHFK